MLRKSTYFIIAILYVALTGCHNTPSEIGAGLVTNQQFGISSLDSITLRASTITYDSLATSNFGGCSSCRLLVGSHDDEKLGRFQSQSIFQLTSPASTSLTSPTSASYTSLVLHLIRDKYYYYDTTQAITLNVYRVTKQLQIFGSALYNVDNYEIDRTQPPLGTLTFLPRPNLKDSVEIPLSDALGQQLFTMLQQEDDNIVPVNFAKFFFGLALIPDSTQSGSLLGFKASPVMRLYYHDYSVDPDVLPDRYISFTMAPSNFFYNKISSDRSATKLANLKTSADIIPSSSTDNEIYLQGGTGVAMRLDMPYLKNLSFIQPNFQVTKALLTLTPVSSSSRDPQNLPPRVLNIDIINQINQTLVGGYSSASLFTDQLGYQTYTVDVTSFVNGQILTTTTNITNGLLFRLANADWNTTGNRLYLGDPHNYFFMKLKVYYITLTDQ